jgi:hypothetical protein
MQQLATALALSALIGLSSACAATRAQTQEPRPPLEVPPVPPRVVEAVIPPQTPELEPVGELPTTPTPPPVRPRPTTREPAQPKSEAKTPETVTEPASAAAQPTPTVPPLRTARTADGAQAERQIRDIIGRANGLLGRVDYRKLSAERRKAYDQAKQFIEGAEGAIRDSKFEYALELADKAETLAKELQG